MLVKLDVNESPNKKNLENPGGSKVLDRVDGTGAGLPFFAFLNAKGEMIVNSKKDGRSNIGHPFQAEEIDWFMSMLTKAAPGMSNAERQTIDNWLRTQKK